jgi:hypothetical protein
MLSLASSGASFKNITPTTGNNFMWLGNTGNNFYVGKESSAGGTLFVGSSAYAGVIGNDGAYSLQFATNNNVRATIDSSGNLGVGITPAGWVTFKAVELTGGAIAGIGTNQFDVLQNAYYDGALKYKTTYGATYYQQTNSTHSWYNAPSGTAGNAITFTQAMTLNASGNLLVGTTTSYGGTMTLLPIGGNPTSASSSLNQIHIGEVSVNTGYALKIGYIYTGGAYYGSLQALAGGSAGPLLLNADGGNVGIGTSSPAGKLEVNGLTFVNNTGSTTGRFLIRNSTTGASAGGLDVQQIGVDASINNASNGYMSFSTNNTERARIDVNGNLLVGLTSNPNYSRLIVRGRSGGSYGGDFTQTNATVQIISDEMSDNQWFPTFNITMVRQSLTTGNGGFGGIGFSTIDDSNNSGMYDAGRIAIINEIPSAVASPTAMAFYTQVGSSTPTNAASERMRIDSSGNLLVGTTSGSDHIIKKAVAVGSSVLEVIGNNTGCVFYNGDGGTPNAANAVLKVTSVGATGRSINAAGTINAAGLDYAEYMTKSGNFTVAKGDVVGIDSQGKLTNVFADAVSFVVKSTNPSYVGGDTWGGDIESDQLEAARQTVDRIAFAGQVPVNVLGATAGQYIIPVNDNGGIKGKSVSNPTFEQYQSSVGKVIAIEADGRARIIVKVT